MLYTTEEELGISEQAVKVSAGGILFADKISRLNVAWKQITWHIYVIKS